MKSQIVVGVDSLPAGNAALEWAAKRAAHSHVRLNLVRVVPGRWSFRHASRHRQVLEQAGELLARKAQLTAALDASLAVTTTLMTGDTARALRSLSRDAEMIVVGTDRRPDRHGEGFGSVSFQTAVISSCEVTVVPAAGADDRAGVVVGTDGSADSDIAVKRAAAEAIRLAQELTVVHACNGQDKTAVNSGGTDGRTADTCTILAAAVAGLAQEHPGLTVHPILERSRFPAAALVRAAVRARLLVIGCKGRGGLDVLVGSVARDVLIDIQCPTLITRPAPKHEPPSPQRQGASPL